MKKLLPMLLAIAMLCAVLSVSSAEEMPENVVARTIGDVTLYSFLSDSVSPVIVANERLVLIDYPGDSAAQAEAYVKFVESLGLPIERMIISHVDAAHWVGIENYLPDVALFSVDAEAIMALPEAAALTLVPIADDAEMTIDGVQYTFVTNRELGAWEVRLPELEAVYVEHLGYVNLHVLLAPLAPRAEMLKALAAEGYTYFMPGHGAPAQEPGFTAQVETYYTDVMAAVQGNADPADAVAEVAEQYPGYFTQEMLAGMLPGLYE